MNEDKKYLLAEALDYLNKSDYLFLTNFQRVTVADLAQLRQELKAEEAEFHVVKNNILRIALKVSDQPELDEHLKGHTALVTGGKNPSAVAKVLLQFADAKDRGKVKTGIVSKNRLSFSEIDSLSKLPPLPILRSQLLGLLNTPAQSCVRVLQAVPESVLNVLQAQSQKAA
jgi:large subunit ribosomal protein L10